jgi:maltose-binding protein MalE
MSDENDWLVKDVRDQVRHTEISPDDPVFRKYAKQAPDDRELYDQISWALQKTREEKEAARRSAAKKPLRPMSLDDAIRAASKNRVIR